MTHNFIASAGKGEFGSQVAEALGLGKHAVRDIHLHIELDSIVTADVTILVEDCHGEKLLALLKGKRLVDPE